MPEGIERLEETKVTTGFAATKAAPAWVMVTVWPAMVSVPVRVDPGLSSNEKITLVLPVPF